MPTGRRAVVAAVATGAIALLAGCANLPKQTYDEPKGIYHVRVVSATFPNKQKLAKRSKVRIVIQNIDSRTVPNLAVTLDGLTTGLTEYSQKEGPVDEPTKTVFSLNAVPANSDTQYVNTYAVGKVRPGEEKSFVWDVTAVKPGSYDLRWKVAAGLDGNAKARGPDGRDPTGRFAGTIVAGEPSGRVAFGGGKTIIRQGAPIGPGQTSSKPEKGN